MAAVTFAAAHLLREYTLEDLFMLVGLAVAAIPKGLPAILTTSECSAWRCAG